MVLFISTFLYFLWYSSGIVNNHNDENTMRIDNLDNLQVDDLDNLQVLSQEELQFVVGGFGSNNIIIGGQGSDTIIGGDASESLMVASVFYLIEI